MKNSNIKIGFAVLIIVTLFGGCKPNASTEEGLLAVSSLPQDAFQSCPLTSSQFNSWFVSGTATENGPVNAPTSVGLVHNDNCDFYQWSAQMFLWLTSSSPNAGTVMESPTFYTVSPKDSSGKRTLIPHVQGQLMRAVSNVTKDGLIDSEEGQATDDVLMAKDGSLIYYISMVNDVYAQFLTGVAAGKLSGATFPTTQAELAQIIAYAQGNGVTLNDANTLTMELKTSWVDASTLADASDYITINAIIPTYTKTATTWTPLKEKQATLALIGVHIVGSTAGHPEMVWATFEHKKNAPNASYTYLDVNKNVKTVSADTGNDWVLNSNAADTTYNKSYMKYDSKNNSIVSNSGDSIRPSNTVRTKPWGVASDIIPNAEDASVAAANSEIISLNASLQKMLVGNDIRKNYIFIGATWTANGVAPNGISYSPTNSTAGVAIGTSQLANSTMETYAQNGTIYNEYGSCFACHNKNNSLTPGSLSHVFSDILPLAVSLQKSSSVKKE